MPEKYLTPSAVVFALLFAIATPLPATLHFTADAANPGEPLGSPFSDETDFGMAQWNSAEADTATPGFMTARHQSLRNASVFIALGGNIGGASDHLVDPLDPSKGYDFTKLNRVARNILRQGLKPFLKLYGVPAAFSDNIAWGSFNVNIRPPRDYNQWHDYVRAGVQSLVDEFGLNEVRSWNFGAQTEMNWAGWFFIDDAETTRREAFKLYDHTVAAVQAVLGAGQFRMGAHLVPSGGTFTWDDFLRHCREGINHRTGAIGTQLDLACISAYDLDPETPGEASNLGRSFALLKDAAAVHGFHNLEYGIAEGYYFRGPDDRDTAPRLFTMAQQGSWLARLYKLSLDHGVRRLMAWRWGTGTFSGIDTLNTHIGNLTHRMRHARRLGLARSGATANPANEVDAVAALDPGTGSLFVLLYNHNPSLAASGAETVELRIDNLIGLDDVQAHAFGAGPATPLSIEQVDGQLALAFTPIANGGVFHTLERSENLATWLPLQSYPAFDRDTLVVHPLPEETPPASRRFFRLHIDASEGTRITAGHKYLLDKTHANWWDTWWAERGSSVSVLADRSRHDYLLPGFLTNQADRAFWTANESRYAELGRLRPDAAVYALEGNSLTLRATLPAHGVAVYHFPRLRSRPLALGAIATASDTDVANGYAPERVNDGEIGSLGGPLHVWANRYNSGLPQWVQLDFGSLKVIDRLELHMPAAYPAQDYQIQYWNGAVWITVEDGAVTGNTLAHRTHAFPPVGASRIRILGAKGPATQPQVLRINEIEVSRQPAPGGGNLALAATTSASETHADYSPVWINDGFTGGGAHNSWSNIGITALPHWVELDFGQKRAFSRVELFTTQAYPIRDYRIEYHDGAAWTPVPGGTVTGNTQISRTHEFLSVTSDRVRIVGLRGPAHQPNIVRINEVRIYE